MVEDSREPAERVSTLIGDRAGEWDLKGALPRSLVRTLAEEGLLCPRWRPVSEGSG